MKVGVDLFEQRKDLKAIQTNDTRTNQQFTKSGSDIIIDDKQFSL